MLLANTLSQAESRLYSLDSGVGGIDLYINLNKTEFMCFRQEEAISTLRGRSLKYVDKFMYLSSNISFTESDVKISPVKVWAARKPGYILFWSKTENRRK